MSRTCSYSYLESKKYTLCCAHEQLSQHKITQLLDYESTFTNNGSTMTLLQDTNFTSHMT